LEKWLEGFSLEMLLEQLRRRPLYDDHNGVFSHRRLDRQTCGDFQSRSIFQTPRLLADGWGSLLERRQNGITLPGLSNDFGDKVNHENLLSS
jgi:hypothetical protein